MGKGRTPSVTRTCENCGKAYHPWKKNKPSRFCSRACAPKGRQATLSDIPCAHCGVVFRPLSADRKFCCRACYVASGGRTFTSSGYALIYRPDHPSSYKTGQILEHRYVMEQKIGRALLSNETVHHINGDRIDNRPENLELRQGRHGNGVVHQCADCGSHNIITVPFTASSGG